MSLRTLDILFNFKSNDGKLKDLDAQISNLTGKFLKFGAASAAVLGSVAIPAALLDRTLRDATAAAGVTGDEFTALNEKLRKDALTLSDAFGFSGRQVAQGFFNVISTGTKAGTRSFDVLTETALKFSKAANTEIGASVTTLSTASLNFFNTVEKSERIADVFFKTNTLAQTSVAELAEAFRDAGPAGAGFGLTLEQTTGILASLAQSGFRGFQAGTALRQILLKLSKPSADAAKQLERLNVNVFDPNTGKRRDITQVLSELITAFQGLNEEQRALAAGQLFGEEASAKFLGLVQRGPDDIRKFTRALEDSSGALDDAFNEIMESSVEQTNRLFSAVKNLAATLGAPLLGPIAAVAGGLADALNAVRQWAEQNSMLATGLVVLVSGALAATAAFSAFQAAILFAKTALAAKLKLVAIFFAKALLLAAALAGVFLIAEDFGRFLQGQKSVFGEVIDGFDFLIERLRETHPLVAAIIDQFVSLADIVMTVVHSVWALIGALGSVVMGDFSGALEQFKKAFMDLPSDLAGRVTGRMSNLFSQLDPLGIAGGLAQATPPMPANGIPASMPQGFNVSQLTINEAKSEGLTVEQKMQALTEAAEKTFSPLRVSEQDAVGGFVR